MSDRPIPARLRDLAEVDVVALAVEHAAHVVALTAALGGEPVDDGRTPPAELALWALVTGEALAERVTAHRWPTVRIALDGQVAVDDVAAALGVGEFAVRSGLLRWADHLVRAGSMTADEFGQVLDLARGAR